MKNFKRTLGAALFVTLVASNAYASCYYLEKDGRYHVVTGRHHTYYTTKPDGVSACPTKVEAPVVKGDLVLDKGSLVLDRTITPVPVVATKSSSFGKSAFK